MPETDTLIWLTGADLLKRWPYLDAFELAMAILHKNLRAFDPRILDFITPSSNGSWLFDGAKPNEDFIEKLRFRESDVLEFESDHLSFDKETTVDSALKDEENTIEDLLKQIINAHKELSCKQCVTMLFAKKALIILKQSGLPGKRIQELGRLKRESEKWDISIDAAVKSALHFSKSKAPVKRDELKDFIYRECNKKVTDTAIDKIWKALPERLKKNAGRPKKLKNP